MNLPLDFDTAEPWQKIVKIALMIAAVYAIAVIGLFLKGNLLGGGFLLLFGLAFYAVLRRARGVSMGAAGRLTATGVTVHAVRVWGFSLNVPSGEFALDRFAAVGVVQRILIGLPNRTSQSDSGTVQLMGRPGTPDIEVMIGDIDAARAFAAELSAALNLELKSVAVPGQTIRRYTV
jgi:hypothetical protein